MILNQQSDEKQPLLFFLLWGQGGTINDLRQSTPT